MTTKSLCVILAVCALSGRLARAQEPLSVPAEDPRALPQTADAALAQAESAYEYGDMPLLVESARLVTDGTLPCTSDQLAQGLRFLGIGLYVTGRVEGAKTAFEQLLAQRPDAQLDRATTRPEIITFFSNLRRARVAQLAEAHQGRRPNVLWNFLPPIGQFKNGNNVKGLVLLAAEATTFIAATTTFAVVKGWEQPDGSVCGADLPKADCPGRTDTANTLRRVNLGSALAFAALYLYGVFDGLAERNKAPSEEDLLRTAPPVSVSLLSNGVALDVRF